MKSSKTTQSVERHQLIFRQLIKEMDPKQQTKLQELYDKILKLKRLDENYQDKK